MLTSIRSSASFRRTVILFAAGTLLRAALILLVHNKQYSDSVWYHTAAEHLVRTGEYGPAGPSAWFPPGYPIFLAAIYAVFGVSELIGRLANAILGGLTCAIVYRLGRTHFSERAGVVAASLIAVWPNVVFHTLILDSESLAVFLFAWALLVGLRERNNARERRFDGLPLGVILGWAMLVRPVAAILFLAIAGYRLARSRSIIGTIGAMLQPGVVAAVIVLAWSARNHARFGEWILVGTNGGYNFWQANQRLADGGDTFWSRVPASDHEYQVMRHGDEFTRNREGYRYGREFLRAHPWFPVQMLPTKVRLLYYTDTSGLYEGILNAPELAPSRIAAWVQAHARLVESATYRFYELIALLAIAAIFLVRGHERAVAGTLISLAILLPLFHIAFHAKDRFHVPLSPAFATLAAESIVVIVTRLAARTRVTAVFGRRLPAEI